MVQKTPKGSNIPNGVNAVNFDAGFVNFLSGISTPMDFSDLSELEINTFDRDLGVLARMYALERALSDLLTIKRDAFLFAASVAKKQFGLQFGGLLGGGFNMQLIRAGTIRAQGTTPSAANRLAYWDQNFGSVGWTGIFGTSAIKYTIGTTGSATTYVTTYSRVLFCAPYLLETYASPRVDEARISVISTDYPVFPISWLPITDLFVAELPASLFVSMNQSFAVEGNIRAAGQCAPQLFGLQFVTHDYAILET